jgi:predicted nucleic acid-binding protein
MFSYQGHFSAGSCEIIISGDKHLLKLSKYQGVAILAPRDFVDRHL